jgi:hypothetical protein
VAHPQPLGHARPVGLDEHVCFGREVEALLPALVALEVDDDAALAGPEDVEQVGHRPHRVAIGRLDLQDIGALLGQELGGVGTGPPDGQVEDAEAIEMARHQVAARSRMCTAQADPRPITWVSPTRAPSI